MSIDPFAGYADGVGAPYAHAAEYTHDDIVAGDIDLPAVTSAIRVHGLVGVTGLKVTLAGGDIVTFFVNGCATLDIRAVKIHQDEELPDITPFSVVALW